MEGVREQERKLVAFCTPTRESPHPAYVAAMKASEPVLRAAGFDIRFMIEAGNPYISGARAALLRRAMDAKADIVVFLDDDVSWRPDDLLALIEAPADVAAGTYRFKKADEEYMGAWVQDGQGKPVGKQIGDLVMLRAERVPAGFLKLTKEAVDAFMKAYPELCYGPRYNLSVDIFNHGAHDGVWFGEDYAFSRRWIETGGDIWLLPELQIDHHGADQVFAGDLHDYLTRQPGGANDSARSEREQSAA